METVILYTKRVKSSRSRSCITTIPMAIWQKGTYVGYTQLATLIKQEKLHNPGRTLLLSSGDNIQGDAMSYYFKTAPTGFTSNGTPIADRHPSHPTVDQSVQLYGI